MWIRDPGTLQTSRRRRRNAAQGKSCGRHVRISFPDIYYVFPAAYAVNAKRLSNLEIDLLSSVCLLDIPI